MNYLINTKKYYSEWLGVDPELMDQNAKLYLTYSPNRDSNQIGYLKPFDLYVFLAHQTTIITYGKKLEQNIDWIREYFENNTDIDEFRKVVKERLGKHIQHDYKYVFSKLPSEIDLWQARQLTRKDYPAFLRFFANLYPNIEAETWLSGYFKKITAKGYAFGFYIGDELVSATDSPDMPYMKESVVEIGINTLPAHRNQGYAKTVFYAMLKYIISIQKVPIVSCTSSNIASQKLIESMGFIKLADVVSISL